MMCYRGNGVRSISHARARVAILLIGALGVLSACQPSAAVSPPVALAGVPVPTDTVADLGGGTVAIDGDRQFVAYRSEASPATALKRFDAQLKAAGYQSVGRRTGWTCYMRGSGNGSGDVVLVYVEPDGPPTTLLVAAGTPADIATADRREPGPPAVPGMGTPDPTSALKPHPGGRGSGGSGGSGNGGGSGAASGGAGNSGQGGGSGSGGNGGSGGQGSGGGNTKPKPSPSPRPHATPRP
jgi:hypothetical protein